MWGNRSPSEAEPSPCPAGLSREGSPPTGVAGPPSPAPMSCEHLPADDSGRSLPLTSAPQSLLLQIGCAGHFLPPSSHPLLPRAIS